MIGKRKFPSSLFNYLFLPMKMALNIRLRNSYYLNKKDIQDITSPYIFLSTFSYSTDSYATSKISSSSSFSS